MGIAKSMERPDRVVLVVDDDADIRDMIAQALELEGWHVVGAGNGEEALRWLRQGTQPVLILLDIMMPGMNGWEFIEAQRREPAFASVPVVLISGDERLPEKAAAAGVAGFLMKPMDLVALLTSVERFGTRRDRDGAVVVQGDASGRRGAN